MNIEHESAAQVPPMQRVGVFADEQHPSRAVSFRNLYQCAYCETCWSSEDAVPGELSDCPGCGRETST